MAIETSSDFSLNLKHKWKLNLGAIWNGEGVNFRVWAPKCKQVDVVIQNDAQQVIPLEKKEDGYFVGYGAQINPGTLYCYRLDGGQEFPDPCSCFQPEGPHGPSMVVNRDQYQWHDQDWKGIEMKGQVIYELHIGAFTSEGTFDAAAKELGFGWDGYAPPLPIYLIISVDYAAKQSKQLNLFLIRAKQSARNLPDLQAGLNQKD